jgi:hypothetical protein
MTGNAPVEKWCQPVGVEEERVELFVEVVVMRHVATRAVAQIELGQPAP